MMKQYFKIKEENKDSILFFRLGDFYEMFFDDAKLASKELELTLTGRDCGQEERAPMCGVPFHSAESYIARLVEKGYKVAICEQTEDPKAAKGLVKRDIIRVITPGTVMESSMLDESENNYICSMYADKRHTGIVFCDISTGQLFVSRFKSDHSFSQLKDQITSYNPRELLISGKLAQNKVLHLFIKEKLPNAAVSHPDESRCGLLDCTAVVEQQFSKENIDSVRIALEYVVSQGLGKKTATPLMKVAGQGSTSQVNEYYGDNDEMIPEFQMGFCGYFPVEKPQYSMIVSMNKIAYPANGGAFAGPVFSAIAEWMFNHGMISKL